MHLLRRVESLAVCEISPLPEDHCAAAAQTGKKSQSGLLGTPAAAIRALPADLHRRDCCPHASPVSADGGQHYFTRQYTVLGVYIKQRNMACRSGGADTQKVKVWWMTFGARLGGV